MRVKLLSRDQQLRDFIISCGDEIVQHGGDWLVSFGHREVILADVLALYDGRALNLHISALPWNRGAHPNYWAWKDNTPHGVTLHWMTDKLDGGPMVAQRRLSFGPGFSFKTSWMRLQAEAVAMFMEFWPELRMGGNGSYHSVAELPSHTNWEERCG